MKRCEIFGLAIVLTLGISPIRARLQLLPDEEPQRVFAGEARPIELIWRNPGTKLVATELRFRLHQASSATTIPLEEKLWKKLEVLPGQTLMERASLDIPAVRAETRFLIQWVEGTNTVVGKTEVLVYPADLLQGLKSIAGGEPIGVLDPQNQLKPLFQALAIEFLDLEEHDLGGFSGKLAIMGPFESPAQERSGLVDEIKRLALKGLPVVWIQPPPGRYEALKPSFYTVRHGKGVVVVVQAAMVGRLAERPLAQVQLMHFAGMAVALEFARL